MNDFGWRLSSDFPATFQRLSSDFRLSDYDQRLSRWSVSDYGWRLSDYDRPPSFLKEVRRFSDLLTGGRVPVVIAAGVLVSWCPGVLVSTDPLPGMCGNSRENAHIKVSQKNLNF